MLCHNYQPILFINGAVFINGTGVTLSDLAAIFLVAPDMKDHHWCAHLLHREKTV